MEYDQYIHFDNDNIIKCYKSIPIHQTKLKVSLFQEIFLLRVYKKYF